jgi:hypothetical protein
MTERLTICALMGTSLAMSASSMPMRHENLPKAV